MDLQTLILPWLVSCSIGIALTGIGTWVLYQMRTQLIQQAQNLHKKAFNRTGFFWTVNIVFMAVSVLHAGVFFGITGNGHDIPGIAQYLGFAVSFFLDLVTIILIQALLEARYRGEEQQARKFLVFIAICCGTSTFANLAISLNDFDPKIFLPHAPVWVQAASPYVLASFPLFVIMMSIAAEMIINVRPLDSLNEDEYEADEKKRLKLLEIRNTYLQKQVDEELRALTIRSQMRVNKQLRKGQLPKSFRWFWEKPLEIDALITGVTTQLKGVYEPQIEMLKRQIDTLLEQVNDASKQQSKTSPIISVETVIGDGKNSSNQADWNANDDNQNASQNTPLQDDKSEGKAPSKPRSKTPEWLSHSALPDVLKAYPKIEAWRSTGRATVLIDDIIQTTNHSRKMVLNRIKDGTLQVSPRNVNLILISSVIDWLKMVPSATKSEPITDSLKAVKVDDKTDDQGVNGSSQNDHNHNGNGHHKDGVNLSELQPLEVS